MDGLTQYTYDASGIRQSVTGNGIVTCYLTDPNRDYAQVIEARDALNALTISYTYGDDLISQHRVTGALISDRERSIFHYDGLGSTRMLTDTAGTVSDSYLYTAFGEDDVTTGITANDYRYTGEQFDPNVGFYYLRARYYNAAIGRFLNRDTYAGRMHEPATLHKYLYVHGNPVNAIDPSGKSLLQLVVPATLPSTIATASFATAARVTVRIIVGIGVAAMLVEIQRELVLANNSSAQISDDAGRRQQEYEVMKRLSQTPPPPPPPGGNECSYLSRVIDHATAVVKRYKKWDQKWHPGRHSAKIESWENRIDNHKRQHKARCSK